MSFLPTEFEILVTVSGKCLYVLYKGIVYMHATSPAVSLYHLLTLNLLTSPIVALPSNASKWQMGFNLAFKGLNTLHCIWSRDSRYSNLVRAGWSGDRFSAPVQTGPGAHPASYTVGTGSFRGVKRSGRGVDHPPHLVPRLKKG
jgi:hypothetical protein